MCSSLLRRPVSPKGDGDRASLQGGEVGIEAARFERVEAGGFRLTVRKNGSTSGPVLVDLLVLQNAGEPGESYRRRSIEFSPSLASRPTFSDGDLR